MKPATIILHIVTALVAIFGVILAIGDKITDIPGLNPQLVNAWPTVFFAATIIDRVGKVLINILTPKTATLLAVFLMACLLPGCANGTRLVEGIGLSGGVSQDPTTKAFSGTGQVTIAFRDGRDAKTIKQIRVQ
jgi:uncharacterized membrane protein